MFNFSVVVIKKLLKTLDTFDPSVFHPAHGSNPFHWRYFSFPFLCNVPCCFYFVISFCCKSTMLLLFSIFYNIS